MKQYNVTGMTCAACSARVEKAVSKVEGVTACAVSLLTNSMGVEGTASPQEIIRAVEEAGYGASEKGAENAANTPAAEDALADRDTPLLKKRLITSLGFLLVLMYVSMGHGMWGWPMPAFFADNPIAIGILQLILTAIVMVINQKFFISGYKSLWHRAPNMDTLVALGSSAAFAYSTYALFAMTADAHPAHWLHEFYFESSAMILTLITVGKMLEARAKGKTTDALKSLMKLAPKTATLIVNGQETEVPVEQVKKGDVFAVRPGGSIPVDGVVLEGHSAVNESALTGESIPVDKASGDSVSAATINQSGFITCEATRVGEDTTLSQIIKMVSDASATKAPIAKIADKVSGVFVPVVITLSLIATLIWLLAGQSIGYALARGISVLVISCPCALGLATPVAIMVGSGVGARNGVLFKTASSLEETGKVRIVALDKTGTITTGDPQVTDVLPAKDVTAEQLLRAAAALEARSEHPLAKAVLHYAKPDAKDTVTDFAAMPGNGLAAKINGKPALGGSLKYMKTKVVVDRQMQAQCDALSEQGKTPLLFALEGRLLGVIAVADAIKPQSRAAVQELKQLGIYVVMLTGDNERTARAIGEQAGVDEVVAGVLPGGKEEVIRKLQAYGKVAMVGDGINDAPALTRADIGIAIGAGADVAVDSADIVLMKSRPDDVPAAIRLSQSVLRNVKQNLFWAFAYNAACIPLAAGAFIPLLGWQLSPMVGAAAMSLSSFCVVSNALRLNLTNIRKAVSKHKDPVQGPLIPTVKEKETMEKTLKIEGMMCMHCENRVRKTLEAIDGVESAVVSHVAGTAVVTLSAPVEDAVLKAAVEAQDYPVLEIL